MRYFLFLVLFSVLLSGQTQLTEKLTNKTFSAKVIGVMDGDTMEILYKNVSTKIRLAHIDSPEKRGKQAFGNQAKIALSQLCFGRIVTVKGEKYDRYKRLIAVVINDKNQNVNQEMVKLGMAWHFTKYSKDPIYASLERQARKSRVGLWKEMNPIEPWLWREKKKQ